MFIIHTGDNHCGKNLFRKTAHFYRNNFAAVCEYCLEKKQTGEEVILVINGDLFDHHYITSETIQFVYTLMKIMKEAGVKIFCALGNHDELNDKNVSPVDILGRPSELPESMKKYNLKNEMFFDLYARTGEWKTYEDDLVEICLVPFCKPDRMRGIITEVKEKYMNKSEKFRLYFSHFPLKDALRFESNVYPSIDELPTRQFDYIGLSDLHSLEKSFWRDNSCDIVYSGATFHTKTNDMGRKPSFVSIEIKDGNLLYDYIELPQPEIKVVETETDVNESLKDSIVFMLNKSLFKVISKMKPLHILNIIKKVEDKDIKKLSSSVSNKSIEEIQDDAIEELEYDDQIKAIIKNLVYMDIAEMKTEEIENKIYSEVSMYFGLSCAANIVHEITAPIDIPQTEIKTEEDDNDCPF